jgi:hypothetical protein
MWNQEYCVLICFKLFQSFITKHNLLVGILYEYNYQLNPSFENSLLSAEIL